MTLADRARLTEIVYEMRAEEHLIRRRYYDNPNSIAAVVRSWADDLVALLVPEDREEAT